MAHHQSVDISNRSSINGEDESDVSEWLENILKRHWTLKEKRNFKTTAVTPEEVNAYPLTLRSADFYKEDDQSKNNDVRTTSEDLSDRKELVKIRIAYKIRKESSERILNILSKLHSNNTHLSDEKDGISEYEKSAHTREVNLHTEVFQDLESWAFSRGADLNFGLPHCFYGEYEPIKIDNDNSLLNNNEQTARANESLESLSASINERSEMTGINTMILLEDISKHGYSRKPLGSHLTVEEVRVAARQVAVIHAVSWAWQVTSKIPIKKKWQIFLNTKQSSKIYGDIIKLGFPIMLQFLEKHLENDPEKESLVNRMKIIEPRIHTFLHTFLIPSTFPAPTSIIHLDLQYRNIFFKLPDASETVDENNNENIIPQNDDSSKCRIVNWGYSTIGSPIHDIAFLMFTSLHPDIRRLKTNSLLKSYYKAFKETCAKLNVELTFDFNTVLTQYPKSFLMAVLFVIGNLTDINAEVDWNSMNIFAEALKDCVNMQLI